MSSPLIQGLFGFLLDSPALVEVGARTIEQAIQVIRAHFTFIAVRREDLAINTPYQLCYITAFKRLDAPRPTALYIIITNLGNRLKFIP
ncbi:hypothetical protein TI03_07295 [Achromatium sp. WMS1]|nr:hypothetical protein TI03_07295 [Achromatium sp. WMS1]